MNRFSAASLAVGWLAGCAPACRPQPAETTAPSAPSTATPATAPRPAATVAQQLSPLLTGQWVSADYLRALARTRSPIAAARYLPAGPSSLQINSFLTSRDSVEIWASYGLHEGGSLLLLLPAAAKPSRLKIKHPYGGEPGITDELSYQLTPTDTTLLYSSRQDKTQRVIRSAAYRRTGTPGGKLDLEAGVNWGVNRLLLTGRYRGTDSLGRPVRAAFATDGTVQGLPFRKYLIQTDFTGPNPGNTVIFDVYTQNRQEFAAAFGRDTVKLYTFYATFGVPPGGTDTTQLFTRGRLRYQLVRVRKP